MGRKHEYVEKNYKVFVQMEKEGKFAPGSVGKYAVLGGEKLIGVFDTLSDADKAGFRVVPKGEYIVQKIGDEGVVVGVPSRNGYTGI